MAHQVVRVSSLLVLILAGCSSEPAPAPSTTGGAASVGGMSGSPSVPVVQAGGGAAGSAALESGGNAPLPGGASGSGGDTMLPGAGEGGDGGGATADPPLDPPPSELVKCLDAKPYVEGQCSPTTVDGWPHAAQACTYKTPIGTLAVTVADASAEQVATWIMDAGDSILAIAHLKASDPASYLRALQSVAAALMIQSSRIFPIAGDVGEDMGGGYIAYPFTKGVTKPCPSGEPHCYCRINSLSRGDYCAYQAFLGTETAAECRTRVGYGKGATDAWLNECIGNHAAAWDNPTNQHIRAQVWSRINAAGLSDNASGPSVVSALNGSYGITSGTVASFCK